MSGTKIAIIVREDLATWQKLNVTAFLTSGLVADNADLVGEPYKDADGAFYSALLAQPVIVLTCDGATLTKVHERAHRRGVRLALYTEDMFATGNDEANRAVVAAVASSDLNIVGVAMCDDRKAVDKITKGAKMHP